MADNLARELGSYLPPEQKEITRQTGLLADKLGYPLYLVGGIVRDMLLNRPSTDLDFMVQGDASRLAKELGEARSVAPVIHPSFNTATLKFNGITVDIASTRRESYEKPGSLPSVQCGATIIEDLRRRDFTVNAIAIRINQQHFGETVDPYNGLADLDRKLIRLLHPASFKDDATRLLRAVRYEQRLGFSLEQETLNLLNAHISYLDTISNDRIRHEIELMLAEQQPEKIIARAGEFGILTAIHPGLEGNGWISDKYARARQRYSGNVPALLYLCLLAYRMQRSSIEEFLTKHNFPKVWQAAVIQADELKGLLPQLTDSPLKPSVIYRLLHRFNISSIEANLLATESPPIRQNLHLFLSRLQNIKPLLNGDDLKQMGITDGKTIGEFISRLHYAKLDGVVKTQKDEEKLVQTWITQP